MVLALTTLDGSRRTQEKAALDTECGVAWIDFPDLPFPFAGAWGHVVFGATRTKHVANATGHAIQPVFSPSSAGCNSSGQPVPHGKAKTWPLPPVPILWPRPKEKLLPARPLQGQHAASTQAAEPAAEHAGTCSLAASPSVLHATRLTLQAPTQPSPAGETAQLHPDAPGCGGSSCRPVPGCANLRLVEQYYKYVLLRDLVTQPRSRKGKRCPGASPPQPRCLRSAARSARVSPSPGSQGGHWAAEQGGGWQSSGWIVQASAGDISATSTERGQCQPHESHFCPLQPPFFFPHCHPHFPSQAQQP